MQQFTGERVVDDAAVSAACECVRAPEPHSGDVARAGLAAVSYGEEQLVRPDSISLLVRHYQPAQETAARTLLLVHGLSEHGERYDHVARVFAGRRWNVVVPDARGHGRSGGTATHVRQFRRYCDDLNAILDHVAAAPGRTAVVGHSMGALVAIRHAQRFPGRAAALALISPLLRVAVRVPAGLFVLGRVLSFVAPRTRFQTRVDPSLTTRSLDVLARRLADPLIHRSVTAGWFFAMRRALRNAWREAPGLRVPLLVLQAGQDRIVDPDAAREWLASAGSADKTFRCLPEHYHELLNEPDWPETATLVADWLDGRVDAVPASDPASPASLRHPVLRT
ncbi:MAG TPA: lysophospholipase [Planctomycetaceae bacterium]|nr:lysophospholipase [Planctomycetaceae bacterium]